jgi:hypothetical protein
MSGDELNELLQEWSKLKAQKQRLDERDEKIKKLIGEIMDKDESNKLVTDDYKVDRRYMRREMITKKDLPRDVWDKYCKKLEYPSYYLKRV